MRILLLTLTTCLLALPAYAKYSGGTGEPNDPYQIATAADLIALGETPADYDKHFILTADIDLDPNLPGRKVFDKAVIAPPLSVNEFGDFWGTPFTGVFDGNGHVISHLCVQGASYLGLFGLLRFPGSICNLSLKAVDVHGTGDKVGGLVGANGGSINTSHSYGSVSGTQWYVGGLTGSNWGSITASYGGGRVDGTGESSDHVGGLVGVNSGSIKRSYSSGSVSGTRYDVGGLVGWNSDTGHMSQCYSIAAVTGGSAVGGVVGSNYGHVTSCYSTGTVCGSGEVGGLVGTNGSWEYPAGSVTQCYSTGVVTGKGYLGGLVGDDSGGNVLHSVWDMETSGLSVSPGGVGLTTAEMMDPYMLGLNGFASDPNWVLDAGRDYPRLAWEGTVGQVVPEPDIDWLEGTGTDEDPYRVGTAEQLIFLGRASAVCDRHIVLSADIDLDPNLLGIPAFGQAVIPAFSGVFHGNGHMISHLTIQGVGHLGLFGQLTSRAEVRDLWMYDVNITAASSPVGGLVASNYGRVTRCRSTGSVSGSGAVGGLVGKNVGTITQSHSTTVIIGGSWDIGGLVGINSGDLTQCYSTGAVTPGDSAWGNVGGLVGSNSGALTQCYSTGAVTPGDRDWANRGGLVGWNEGNVNECYSTGLVRGGGLVGSNLVECLGTSIHNSCWPVGVETASFWDIETSGQATSAGGTGKTTAEMQTATTFLDAGWDFVGETGNGRQDIWAILEGRDYPRFAWQHLASWASCPNPWDGAIDVHRSPILSWHTSTGALAHDVYFAEDETAVTGATAESESIYRGRQAVDVTTYDTGVLEWGKTYYWRIDEVNEADPNSPWKGKVWSFTTTDYILALVVDEFESYTDEEGSRIWETWIDGIYIDANSPGNGTGSSVGNWEPPFAEQTIVHGGKQSMPMDYNDVGEPWYSEAERTWATARDWRIDGVDTLTLYFRGEGDNGPDPLYVGIEDSGGRMAVVVHPDAEAVLAIEWQKWHIALGEVQAAGVDVAAVKKMVIGVGDRKNPKPGGTGRVYIDDIRLTKRMP